MEIVEDIKPGLPEKEFRFCGTSEVIHNYEIGICIVVRDFNSVHQVFNLADGRQRRVKPNDKVRVVKSVLHTEPFSAVV